MKRELHWKPTTAEPPPVPSLKQKGTFWNKLDLPAIDANKLVQLFEAKQPKEVTIKKVNDSKPQILQVLSMKRSQAINIGLTKLPPITVIPAAIQKFDSMNDIAEPLMDLQLGMKEIQNSKTFRVAMGMLLALGNSLGGTKITGFHLDYLSKASEVKDPVYKHTLTYHLAEYMIEHFPEGTDLYSEFGAVARSARVDYKELYDNLKRLEKECKASWDYLAKISKNDNSSMKQRINDYLTDVAERIHQLNIIYKGAKNRWHAFLIYFGYSVSEIPDQTPNETFKMVRFNLSYVTEFALEYRTTRDKILQQKKRMAEKRERNKTRGKIWALEGGSAEVDGSRRRAAPQATNSLQVLLPSLISFNILCYFVKQGFYWNCCYIPDQGGDSPEDEILNGLVKAATLQAETRDHRRKARQFNRKSLRRTRTLKLADGQLETNY
uniref:FH2 domain-containing protein n=1 Tax=Heterorhabditis bacteriophora TaxID=37862 RepID=A0A1I7XEF9_HETBA